MVSKCEWILGDEVMSMVVRVSEKEWIIYSVSICLARNASELRVTTPGP
jgi:hypothetical protein